MSLSCLALNREANLPSADIEKEFLIELVIVTDSWKIHVHTPQGDFGLEITGEGKMIKASLQAGTLERADHEEMDPILWSAISQAICDDPQIGRIWVVHYEGTPRFMFTLRAAVEYAAVDAKTRTLQISSCCWYEALATTKEKLAGIKGKPKTTYNHHDLSTEQEKSAISKGGYVPHDIGEYQKRLKWLDMMGERNLKQARNMDRN